MWKGDENVVIVVKIEEMIKRIMEKKREKRGIDVEGEMKKRNERREGLKKVEKV